VIELTKVIMKAPYLSFDQRWNFGPELDNCLLKTENDMKYFVLLYRKKVYGIVDPFREHCLDFTAATRDHLQSYFKQRIPQFKQITAASLCQDFLHWSGQNGNINALHLHNHHPLIEFFDDFHEWMDEDINNDNDNDNNNDDDDDDNHENEGDELLDDDDDNDNDENNEY
jgi:hypothetical protein